MRYFDHRPLKEGPERDITKEYMELAQKLDNYLPNGAEKSEALRDLLKSKDSAVRSALDLPSRTQEEEPTEELDPVEGEEEEGKEKEPETHISFELHYDTLPDGVTVNGGNPPTSTSGIVETDINAAGKVERRVLSDIEAAQVKRLMARRMHGYS